ncbi:uncharacterized protein PHACADRAFT_124009 [Phanerochaete carnosa HHB-10118-sp]|uniref:AB hydrolase-1 domain-containing protein n=1 Tax=Phanerochaete carnosa (strain HHB-10118-sp) TaxID=650164 RepID=K5W6A5_PHACS|nr:uncharacterized protein PHACADRAFT_124009 [Phanerochaete carnosa HHB-10118-sp]EKM54690.1 hypothetical protein PHACADRAFT_124009 [Phanerochaete carnosa HHB-10118-sp]
MSQAPFEESKTQYYHHGRFSFAGGSVPNAYTAYRTYGDSTKPCIVYPTCYGGKLDSQLHMIGPNKALDSTQYFIVTFALFSNGEQSSSPSNTPEPYNGPYFPVVTYEDNIRAQHAVLVEKLGVKRIYCVIGFSMGGQQAYYWPVMFPDFVDKFVVICGSARTSPHNQCFLEGPRIALAASRDYQDGHYTTKPQHGIRAFARVYSAWAYGQAWYRQNLYLYGGKYTDLNDFIRSEWEAGHLANWDANDMLVLLRTWQMGDISKIQSIAPSLQGDLVGVLKTITAKGLIMPCVTDLYFPPEDSEAEVEAMGSDKSQLQKIPSIWGHRGKHSLCRPILIHADSSRCAAGGGANPEDIQFVAGYVRKFLKKQ